LCKNVNLGLINVAFHFMDKENEQRVNGSFHSLDSFQQLTSLSPLAFNMEMCESIRSCAPCLLATPPNYQSACQWVEFPRHGVCTPFPRPIYGNFRRFIEPGRVDQCPKLPSLNLFKETPGSSLSSIDNGK
jgi:hypothetical protein